MCYVLCAMYYVLCTMYCNMCPVHYLLSPIQLYIHESAGPIQHVYVGQVGKKLNVSQLLAQLRKSFITTVTSSKTNTRRSELTWALFTKWNIASHPRGSIWNIQTTVNQFWDIINPYSNHILLLKSLDAWLEYPGENLAFGTLWKSWKNLRVEIVPEAPGGVHICLQFTNSEGLRGPLNVS